MKVAGHWTYLYRAVDQFGQVIDVLASERRDLATARRFFTRALVDVQYANNSIEADHGRFKARLCPMRG